jgi:hypothetical protein
VTGRPKAQPEGVSSAATMRRGHQSGSGHRRHVGFVVALIALAVEAAAIRRLGYPFAGDVVVRCRKGHLFTTIWVPGVSLKSARLGWWRFQRCPVGRHWELVTPVRRADLTPEEQRSAAEATDIRIP